MFDLYGEKYPYTITLLYQVHSVNIHSLSIIKIEADPTTRDRIENWLTKKYNIAALYIREPLSLD